MNETVSWKRTPRFTGDAEIEIAVTPNAGACFGVVRAIKLGEQALAKSSEDVVSFGPLIHNPQVVADLQSKGLKTIQEAEEVSGGTVILRSHGVRKEIEADFKARGVRVVDATCPLVKKPQRIATTLGNGGYFLVLVGDRNHPEVKGVLSYFGREDFLVTYDPADVEKIPPGVGKVGVIAQTTIEYSVLAEVEKRCRARFAEVVVHNTICDATSVRQEEADALAREADVVIVVGGRNSSNTKKLEKICLHHQKDTYLVETLDELKRDWFLGKKRIGVTGGASTPQEYVDRVGERIADLLKTH